MADPASPNIFTDDGLTAFGKNIAGQFMTAGLKALGWNDDPVERAKMTGTDTEAQKAAGAWNWQKTALVVGAVIVVAFVLLKFGKR